MRVSDILARDGLIESDGEASGETPGDITRTPLEFPMERDSRLQALSRGDEGFLLALGYSTQRGYARSHPLPARSGSARSMSRSSCPNWAFGDGRRIQVTECQMVNQFRGSSKAPPQFTRGYGLVFGQSERKAMAMALCDRSLRARELGEDVVAPAQDEEFVISHSDNVQASGFVEHLKLPHYVDFQAELELVRAMRAEHEARRNGGADMAEAAE
ncbi:carbon-phosphorus lyase complex subunit PhnI [Roseitalea porphyridii]|uniref:carbon-phosphorus lyase complex subunit PhnI n=1 Tax=Roseitalea porphyridii TaxID=1852022 RepID=UPI002452A91E|nr:carbon-phosphorus lyase complex subunit PhnI [Roseitalea porphyridii]